MKFFNYKMVITLLLLVLSFSALAQTPFTVNYNFNTDLSGTLTEGSGITMSPAVSGGSKLSGATVTTDGGLNIWRANVVNNNATNYTNTFIRFDIYPPSGFGMLVSDILVNQKVNVVSGATLFRIGCTLNGVTPTNSNTDQSTGNTLFKDFYSVDAFTPGNSVNYVIGSDYISVFVCARGNGSDTVEWSIDDIEIKGTIIDAPEPSLVINNTKEQLIEVMGGDMERSSAFIQQANNTSEILDWFIKDIDFNYFRVQYDKNQEITEGVNNWGFYSNQVLTMKGIRQVNPNIKFLATMRSDYNGFKTDNHNNLPVFIYNYECLSEDASGNCNSTAGDLSFDTDKYGVFLADYIEFMFNEGVAIDYLATSKEWQIVTVQRARDSYIKMSSELTTRGIPIPKIIGPATYAINTGINYVNSVVSNNYQDDYFAFSTHNLSNTPTLWSSFVTASNNGGKIGFDDESGYFAGGRTSGVEPTDMDGLLAKYADKYDMYEGGISGEIFFEIWSRGVSSETRSVYFRNGTNGYRMRSYYVMKNFANSAVNKNYCKVVALSFAPNVTAIVFRDDEVASVWLINESNEAYTDMDLEISGETIYGDMRQLFWDDASQKDAYETIISNSNSGETAVKVSLSPKSINYFRLAINPSAILSVNNVEKSDLKLYPNPSKNYFIIDSKNAFNLSYKIYNTLGAEVKMGTLRNKESVDVSKLVNGIYLVKLGNQSFKFLKN